MRLESDDLLKQFLEAEARLLCTDRQSALQLMVTAVPVSRLKRSSPHVGDVLIRSRRWGEQRCSALLADEMVSMHHFFLKHRIRMVGRSR